MAQLLTGSLVRLVVTVATLAAIYFFIVRPVLDTTNEALDKPFTSPVDVQREIDDAFDDAGVNNVKVPRQGLKQARKMLACVEKADNDATALSLCAAQ